jgi:hypothetical protein
MGGFLRFLDKNADLISLGATIFGAITTPLTLPWFLALTIAFAVVAAGLIMYLDTFDCTCGLGPVALYAATGIIALSFGVVAKNSIDLFLFWFIGFFVDGSIRGATEKKF